MLIVNLGHHKINTVIGIEIKRKIATSLWFDVIGFVFVVKPKNLERHTLLLTMR